MSHYDLYAIGNALVDSEYEVSDAQLKSMGVDKRHMTLIDTPRRAQLLEHVKALTPRQTGGGSAGNTVVALAQLGGKAFYSCKVAHDALGDFYVKDLQARGVDTNLNHTRASEGQTGSCLVLVTPDAERSMCTFLGVSAELDDAALHPKDIEKSKIYYMEGYLAASPTGLAAALKGRQIAREAGVALALTLSDVSMIQFCKAGLDAMLGDGVDYLFCNQEEAQVWCGSQDLNVVKETLKKLAKMVCLTRGPDGSEIITAQNSWHVPAEKVQAIDTNGAGDMFAGAFLYAITRGYSPDQAANLGNHAAAAVVSQHGNRLTLGQLSTIKAYALPAHK
ncbi:adenosine kinase [Limnohabitans sp. MMS-10A-178]|jgi:sugar/nucleoside kinase (ribokinase family)|nr:adenosine kinase [Limnohabitans sp. MMS-10A-178]